MRLRTIFAGAALAALLAGPALADSVNILNQPIAQTVLPPGATRSGNTATQTTASTPTQIIAASAGQYFHATTFACSNPSSTTVVVVVNDSYATSFVLGPQQVWGVPLQPGTYLVTPINTALNFQFGPSNVSPGVICEAIGFLSATP